MSEILDACCGGRHWWWDKAHPLAVGLDVREAPRGAVGAWRGHPALTPEPSTDGDSLNPDYFGVVREEQ